MGYDHGFPRACSFIDVDAFTEFDGRCLAVEWKYEAADTPPPPGWSDGAFQMPPPGQERALRWLARRGVTVLVCFRGRGEDNPVGCRNLNTGELHDWRALPVEERRQRFKTEIDQAMGLAA